jgi:hypothetical protein
MGFSYRVSMLACCSASGVMENLRSKGPRLIRNCILRAGHPCSLRLASGGLKEACQAYGFHRRDYT